MSIDTDERRQRGWGWAVVLIGAVYSVVGLIVGELAKQAGSIQMRTTWRLSAWAISGIAFVGHIAYEQFRVRTSRTKTALHVSLAAAIGAFALAVAANVHSVGLDSGAAHRTRLAWALVSWPMLTAIPAFLVALALAAAMALRRRGSPYE
jgi:cytochrome bd-type quinol oxidase subunit 2